VVPKTLPPSKIIDFKSLLKKIIVTI
jgi:hypothetical protein